MTTGVHVAAAILADSITLLSNSWTDVKSIALSEQPGPAGGDDHRISLRRRGGEGAVVSISSRRVASLPLRHRRWRRQLPAAARGLADQRSDHQLSRVDHQPVPQPAGGRHIQVLQQRLHLQQPRLQLRRRLPGAGAAAAGDTDVQRREHADVQAAAAADAVAPGGAVRTTGGPVPQGESTCQALEKSPDQSFRAASGWPHRWRSGAGGSPWSGRSRPCRRVSMRRLRRSAQADPMDVRLPTGSGTSRRW